MGPSKITLDSLQEIFLVHFSVELQANGKLAAGGFPRIRYLLYTYSKKRKCSKFRKKKDVSWMR